MKGISLEKICASRDPGRGFYLATSLERVLTTDHQVHRSKIHPDGLYVHDRRVGTGPWIYGL